MRTSNEIPALASPQAKAMALFSFSFQPNGCFGCLLKRAKKPEEQITKPPGGKSRWNKTGERRHLVKSREFCLLLNMSNRYSTELVDGHLEEAVR